MANTEEARDRQVGGDHYLSLGLQLWDALRAWLTPEQFSGFLLGNAVKYLARFNAQAPGKGGVADLEKAAHYLQRLIQQEQRP